MPPTIKIRFLIEKGLAIFSPPTASDSFLVPVVVGGISAAVVIAVLCIVGIAVSR